MILKAKTEASDTRLRPTDQPVGLRQCLLSLLIAGLPTRIVPLDKSRWCEADIFLTVHVGMLVLVTTFILIMQVSAFHRLHKGSICACVCYVWCGDVCVCVCVFYVVRVVL